MLYLNLLNILLIQNLICPFCLPLVFLSDITNILNRFLMISGIAQLLLYPNWSFDFPEVVKRECCWFLTFFCILYNAALDPEMNECYFLIWIINIHIIYNNKPAPILIKHVGWYTNSPLESKQKRSIQIFIDFFCCLTLNLPLFWYRVTWTIQTYKLQKCYYSVIHIPS